MKAEPVNSPAKQAPGEWQTQQVLLGNKCPWPQNLAVDNQGRMIYRAGIAIGALPFFLRLTVTPRRDGADDHHGITPARRATDCSSCAAVRQQPDSRRRADRLGVV
jgi:hypothetical protein